MTHDNNIPSIDSRWRSLLPMGKWVVQNHTLVIALLLGLGITAGYMTYQVGYGIFGLRNLADDRPIYGIVFLGLLYLSVVVIVMILTTVPRRRVVVTEMFMITTCTVIALSYKAYVIAAAGGVFALAFIAGRFPKLFRLLNFSLVPHGIAAASTLVMITSMISGGVFALKIYEGRRASVVAIDPKTNETLSGADLGVIAHTGSTWYFVDRNTPMFSATVYAIPDSQVISVTMAR